jgi:hypothetical protein
MEIETEEIYARAEHRQACARCKMRRDVFWDPMVCEYTIQKPMAGQAYVWGYLAARARQGAQSEQ